MRSHGETVNERSDVLLIGSLATALQGRYTIDRELGAGGMATVYLAQDVKHDRKVALKLLRPELAAVIGAVRFLNEIKTTANLQHPHILALHDSGEVEGTVFYVMPYVDGESLRDKLNREKQLPVDEAIRIAVEVAGALEYAHTHGVIHRDIKPENILLQGGHALVADFGIALAASRTDGSTRMTETGMSLGTPHYMSPEQAMGEREITAKADVYALGCVLYEMLTGEPPFNGPTAQAIVARVMTEEPRSLTLQRRTVPRHVEAAVNRALSKLPADRFAGAALFADALVNPASFTEAAHHEQHAVVAAKRSALVWLAGGAIVAAAAAFFAGRSSAPEPARELAQFTVRMPDSVPVIGRCCGIAIALSPDGRTLVFVGLADSPLYRREIGRLTAEKIPGTEGGAMPFFSPDGLWVGFVADGRLKKVSLAGGPPLPITNVGTVSEASWGDNDVIVYASERRLWTVAAGGGQPSELSSPDSTTAHYAPFVLPGSKAVLHSFRQTGGALETVQIGVLDVESKRIDTIGLGTRASYAGGYLLFAGADGTLLAQPFDLRTRETRGQAVAILDGLVLHGGTTHEVTVTASGSLAVQRSGSGQAGRDLLLIDGPDGRQRVELPGRSASNLEDPAFGPGGRRIAITLAAGSVAVDASDVWMLDRQQGTLERFTVGGGWQPVWSPNGQEVAVSKTDGIYVKRADGTGADRLLIRGASLTGGSWLPDGRSYVFQAGNRPNTRTDIGVVTIGDTVPRWLVQSEFADRHPQVSRDGRWLAYGSDRTGRQEIYVQPFAGDGPRVQVSTEGGSSPRWSVDGRTLYYVSSAAIIAATRAPGAEFAIASRRTVVNGSVTDLNGANVNWDLHPNGREFLFIDQSGGEGVQLVWILNWTELVRAMTSER